jgi:hypothetical protein
MIANSAFLAAMVVVLLLFVLMDRFSFLVPYKRLIFTQHLWVIVTAIAGTFVNLFALFYTITRRVFLKDTGRKLAHVDRQLLTPDTIVRDLSDRLSREE